jgi:hypothetical protein
MKKLRLKVDDLHVESFTALEKGGVKALSEPGGGTHSLDYATHCDCSGGPRCTQACIEYSQATDILACCG